MSNFIVSQSETRASRTKNSKQMDLIHKSQNAPIPYPTMLHPEPKRAHFCSEWIIMGYKTDAFWDLWNWFTSTVHIFTMFLGANRSGRELKRKYDVCCATPGKLQNKPVLIQNRFCIKTGFVA